MNAFVNVRVLHAGRPFNTILRRGHSRSARRRAAPPATMTAQVRSTTLPDAFLEKLTDAVSAVGRQLERRGEGLGDTGLNFPGRAELVDDVLAAICAELKTFSFRVSALPDESSKDLQQRVATALSLPASKLCPLDWLLHGAFLAPVELRQHVLEWKQRSRSAGVYLQSRSSMASAVALDVQPGERVLDLCAAPGSKCSLLALQMNGQGSLIANDRSRQRCFKLRSVIAELPERLQRVVRVVQTDGLNFRRQPCAFHRVLVDAPCSGEGRFAAGAAKEVSNWSAGLPKRLSSTQKALLHAAIDAVKPGGVVVYSTCTLNSEENECVVERALELYSESRGLHLEAIKLPLDEYLWALPGGALVHTSAKRGQTASRFSEQMVHCRRILPRTMNKAEPAAQTRSHPPGAGEGFFIARFRAQR